MGTGTGYVKIIDGAPKPVVIEMWAFINSFQGPRTYMLGQHNGTAGWTIDESNSGTKWYYATGGGGDAWSHNPPTTLTTGAWHWLVWLYSGGAVGPIDNWIDGVWQGQLASRVATVGYGGFYPLTLGYRSGGLYGDMYLDDLRITQNSSRGYVSGSSIAVPTAALTAV